MGQFDYTNDPIPTVTAAPSLDPMAFLPPPQSIPAGPPTPMPTPPAAPGRPGGIQQLVQAALSGLAAGMGPQHGGTGVLEGMLTGQHANDQARQLQYQNEMVQYRERTAEAHRLQQEADRLQQQQQQRQQALQQALMTIRGEVKTIPDKATYDQRIDGYAGLLQASGYRLDGNQLRTMVPYVAPTSKALAVEAVTNLFKNPLYQQQLKENPQTLQSGSIMVDLNGDGIKEKRTIQEVLEASGMSLLLDDAGKPLGLSRSTEGPIAQIALKAKLDKFRADNRREPDPTELDKIVEEARTTPKDPLTDELARQRLADAKDKAADRAKNGKGLSAVQQRRVDMKTKAFDSMPLVKNTQKMSEAVGFAQSLDPNTKNPADDQALIYAFAKAMDPDSVVREGEYATVQKYAQSWAESFGFNAARILQNTAFLTPQARANMKKTILAKFSAGQQQYDAVRKSYISQINRITGSNDGDSYLTDFGAAFPDALKPTTPGKNPFRHD